MSADVYLKQILNREAVDTGIFSPVRTVQATLEPAIRLWANRFLIGISPSGSFAKGTANKSGTDIDLFITLSSETGETLKEISESLFTRMQEIGYLLPAQDAGDRRWGRGDGDEPLHRPHSALPGGARSGRGRRSRAPSNLARPSRLTREPCEVLGGAEATTHDVHPVRGRAPAHDRRWRMAKRVISPLAGPRFGGDDDSDVADSTAWPNGYCARESPGEGDEMT